MAMERQYMIRETHTRSLTAVGFNPSRREFLVGCEGKLMRMERVENVSYPQVFF